MTYDLRAGLAAIGRQELSAAPDLPVDALTARAHRLHTTHAVQYSAIGVSAAAVLTLGAISADGLLLNRDPAPVPPATDEPGPTPDRTTSSPTPTPTPSSTPTEVAWEPSWDLCGMPAEDLVARDRDTGEGGEVEGAWFLTSDWPPETPMPDDAPFALGLRVFAYPETPAGAVDARLTEVVAITWDETTGEGNGTVSAVAAVPVDAVALRDDGGDIGGLPFDAVEMSLVSCAASPLTGGDGALDNGLTGDTSSSVFALADIIPDGGETYTSVAFVGYLGDVPEWPELPDSEPTATTGPAPSEQDGTLTVGTPLRLGPAATWNNSNLPAGEQGLWCGAAASTTPLRNDPVPGMTLTGTGFRDGDELIVQMTLTNTWGSPLPSGLLIYPYMGVSSSGWILGSANANMSSYTLPEPLQPGESVQLEMSLGRSTCALMGSQPWPAGTYELHAGAFLLVGAELTQGIPGYEVRTTFTLD